VFVGGGTAGHVDEVVGFGKGSNGAREGVYMFAVVAEAAAVDVEAGKRISDRVV
jgi:hypothetical protein